MSVCVVKALVILGYTWLAKGFECASMRQQIRMPGRIRNEPREGMWALQAGSSGAGAVDDFASTIAGFPPDVREEVLMTAEDSVLATLPPSILAEAQVRTSPPVLVLKGKAP